MEKKPRSYKAWSGYDDKTLIDLRDQNVSIRIISGVMLRTESSIHNRIAVLKLGTKKKINSNLKSEQKFIDKYIKWNEKLIRMLFRR